MKSNAEHTCPVCEFEKGNSGEAVKQADGMVCLSCGASWKIIASENNQEVMPNAADYKLASSALVDNRVFNKRHYEAPKQQSNAAIPEKQTSAYGVAAMCFVLLISAGLFLQTWVWLNPEAKELTLSKVELQEMVSQNGSNVYQVRGVLSNETSKSKQVPRIAIVWRIMWLMQKQVCRNRQRYYCRLSSKRSKYSFSIIGFSGIDRRLRMASRI